jgi:hypothetical protein
MKRWGRQDEPPRFCRRLFCLSCAAMIGRPSQTW